MRFTLSKTAKSFAALEKGLPENSLFLGIRAVAIATALGVIAWNLLRFQKIRYPRSGVFP
jgi:hypothetical protein